MIITIRTDNPNAEIGIYNHQKQLQYHTWHAGRSLARDLLRVLHEQLQTHTLDWDDITGIVVFQGPGSFTGLRIGLTVANTLAYGQHVPIVATQGDNWIGTGLKRLAQGEDDKLALPFYGADAHITMPKK